MSGHQLPLLAGHSNHVGWFPVQESAIRRLKSIFDNPAAFRKAQLAYMVLLRVANLEGSDTFSRRIASLADDLGYNYDETAQALKLVEQAGLLVITQQQVPGSRERAPSMYRVIRMSSENPATSPEIPATSPGKEARLPESLKPGESPRVSNNVPRTYQEEREASPPRPRFQPPSVLEAEAYAVELGMPATEGPKFINHHLAAGWILKGGRKMVDWRASMRTWRVTYLRIQANGKPAMVPLQNGHSWEAPRP